MTRRSGCARTASWAGAEGRPTARWPRASAPSAGPGSRTTASAPAIRSCVDGLRASVIYGPLALGFPISDPTLQTACYAAWNDWAVQEFNAHAPDRLCVLAFLPSHSAETAAAELHRCAEIGHRGAILDVFSVDLGDPAWDALWAAAQDTRLPISFHLKGGSWSSLSYRMGRWQSAAFASIL
ncbi:MAG: hypothetical protein E6G57_17820, partial [Actinobacteria bacterium]